MKTIVFLKAAKLKFTKKWSHFWSIKTCTD